MAEKKKETKKPASHSSKGGIPFGLEVIFFIVIIFIIWVLTGGSKNSTNVSPTINPADLAPVTPTSSGYTNSRYIN